MKLRIASVFALLAAIACGDDATTVDAGNDADAPDSGRDSGPPRDAGDDAPTDAPMDVPTDAGDDAMDAGPGFPESYALMAQHPEGGAYDWEGQRFFMGSLVDGNVRVVDANTGEDTEFFAGEDKGVWWTLGMDIDAERDRLWVCAMEDRREADPRPDPPYDGYVWVFDLTSGERVDTADLSVVNEAATCTDVAVDGEGTAYIVDREAGNIYSMVEGGEPELFRTASVLEAGIGQNAAVIDDGANLLFIVTYLPSRLVRVPLAGGTIREVNLTGDDFRDPSPIMSGADGIAQLPDGNLLVAFTSQVTRVVPTTGDWMNGNATTVDVPAGVTDVIATEGGPYLLNGQAVRFALSVEPEPFTLTRFTGF